jgi:very-short-patch-repair endonuclease
MGRTLPTIIRALDLEKEDWKLFRRALRKEDQEAYDALWRYVRRHAAPSAMASRAVPLESVFMSMLVGLQRVLTELKRVEEERNRGVDL